MNVIVISETKQEFNGIRYWRGKHGYFSRPNGKGKVGRAWLHRVVWEHHHGPIPTGFVVHHKDDAPSNNQPGNLELLDDSTHKKHHMRSPQRRKQAREAIKKAIEAAPLWHKSKAGKAWHVQHSKNIWTVQPKRTYACIICGRSFKSRSMMGARFCGPNCKQTHFRNTHPNYYSDLRKKKSKPSTA